MFKMHLKITFHTMNQKDLKVKKKINRCKHLEDKVIVT